MQTLSKQESEAVLTEILEEMGLTLRPSELADFGCQGGETTAELAEWASDYASEVSSERCAEKQAWMYQQ